LETEWRMKKTPGRPISPVRLSEADATELSRRVNAQTTSKRDHLRASIILSRASGRSQAQAAGDLTCSRTCVSKWTARFRRSGLAGLADAAGRGRKPSIALAHVEAAITRANRSPKGRERWSRRTMAKELGISPSSVGRIWNANDLKPHRVEMFKVSNDPKFEEKFWDVIGLYLNPPDRAMVLCCDEKSQCQALERTQQALLNANFGSLKELAQRILDYIAEHNLSPKRYVWKAEGQAILEKIQRARQKLAEEALN
jgi:transposase